MKRGTTVKYIQATMTPPVGWAGECKNYEQKVLISTNKCCFHIFSSTISKYIKTVSERALSQFTLIYRGSDLGHYWIHLSNLKGLSMKPESNTKIYPYNGIKFDIV